MLWYPNVSSKLIWFVNLHMQRIERKKNSSIFRILIFVVVRRIFAWYCATISTLVTYKLLTRKRGVVNSVGNNGVGGRPIGSQTVKKSKLVLVRLWRPQQWPPYVQQILGALWDSNGHHQPSGAVVIRWPTSAIRIFLLSQQFWLQQSIGLLTVVAAS